MDINLFDYHLPLELIAQHPEDKRDHSRLLVVNKKNQTFEDKHFFDILNYFKAGDVLVRNNTKVIPARLYGQKAVTGAKVEVLLLRELGKDTWECLIGNAKAVKEGTMIQFSPDLTAVCLEKKAEGIHFLKFIYEGIFIEILERIGHAPLPPYIKDDAEQYRKYQTVYAKIDGSAAAPTAGFHFTKELLELIQARGVEIVDITLHVGLGTFRPVAVSDTNDHIMHFEYYMVGEEAARVLNRAKSEGRRIIAVGTTSTRTLEANITKNGVFKAESEKTNLFITPGYQFKAVNALITNFHLPKSTLIMLVSALSNRELIMKAYEHAVNEKYRFFSFGDAMFIYE